MPWKETSVMDERMKFVGRLLAGGMLIPGNIPNIIAASKLNIKSKDWTRLGVPLGLILMTIYFFILNLEF